MYNKQWKIWKIQMALKCSLFYFLLAISKELLVKLSRQLLAGISRQCTILSTEDLGFILFYNI